MKIEELPHIEIRRIQKDNVERKDWYISGERKKLLLKNGYYPIIDCMADSYSSLSRVLDKDCVVAYITDKSQTTFLVKTKCKYLGFISLSKKLSYHLSSHTTRKITKIYEGGDKGFMSYSKDEDLIIADKDLWDKYLKTKILESLSK